MCLNRHMYPNHICHGGPRAVWVSHFESDCKEIHVQTHSTTSIFRSCVSLQSTEGYLLSHEEFRSHLANNIAEHSWCEVNSVEREVTEDKDTGIQSKQFHQSEGGSYETNSHPSWNQENSQQRLHAKDIANSIEQIQPSSEEKPYSCTLCEYSSSRSDALKRHMRVHTSEKPYGCPQCDYSCTQSSTLKVHMRMHTGEKPYSCTQCNYSSSRSDALKRHKRVHTGEKPYRCAQCNFSCAQPRTLRVHMKKHNWGANICTGSGTNTSF